MFLVVAVSLLLAAVVLISLVLLGRHHSEDPVRKMPGPKTNLLFGNVLQLPRLPNDLVTQILQWVYEYHNGMFCLWLGPTYPFIFLYKPELVEVVLHSSKHISKSADYDFLHPWLGTGHDGSKWKTRRRLITPTFHFSILNTFLQVFEEQSKILVSNLEKKIKTGTFNIMPYITLCALDIICITSMDSSPNAQGDTNSPYVKAVGREFHNNSGDSGKQGHDTTAAGLTWALYLLARHPHVQQQVHEEVDKFFEQRPETLTVEDLKDLRYLECVVKEAQRMFPSVPFIARTTTEDCHL
ncbi:hypothetical protein pdam_00021921, partial [Pocillopora damicornis]